MTVKQRFQVAGHELMKGKVGSALKALTFPQLQVSEVIASSGYRGNPSAGNFWMFSIDGVDRYFTTDDANGYITAFNDCPPVSSIILQKAQAFVNGKIWVMDTQGKAKEKEATGDVASKIKALLSQPNPYQSKGHFEAQVYINTMVFGFTIILPIKPNGFPNYESKQLWAVPGNMIEVEESDEPFFSYDVKARVNVIKRIWLTYKSKRTELNANEVLIIRDFGPSFCSIAFPDSRIKRLKSPIKNIVGALESRGVLIRNRGPRFVVSNAAKDSVGTVPMTPEEKTDMEENFKSKYGLLKEQTQAILTSATLNVSTIGFDVKQLGLMEEVQESSSMLCIGLGFPKFLAGLSDPTFNNQDTAEKSLYQRFIIPEACNIYEQLNNWFEAPKYNLRIDKDFSDLPVLQEDKINLGRARLYLNQALLIEWQNNMITANEWRIANGCDPLAENGDMYYYQWVELGKTFGNSPISATAGNIDNNTQNTGNNGKQP